MKETQVTESWNHIFIFVVHPIIIIIVFLYSINLTICDSISAPSDTILLDCGSSGESSYNGARWIGDIGSSFLLPKYSKSSSTLSVLNQYHKRVPKIPYSTTRIIHSPLNYTFSFTPSLKFIRIYFLSASYLNMNPSKAYFSVKAGCYTLLSSFSPFVASQELNLAYFTKDFLVNVVEEKLNITIIPSSLISNAFAFVNGIEIFSVPSTIYFPVSNFHVPYLGHQELNISDHQYALEMLYRVSIHEVENVFGAWVEDSGYLYSSLHGSVLDSRIRPLSITYNTSTSFDFNYSAPEELYWIARTMGSNQDANMEYNLTWSFPVDSGFKYLVRLHFCEISMEVTKVNQRVFKVYINNQTAEERMDLVALVGAPFVAFYKDYVVMVPRESERRRNMSIALHPNIASKPKFADAILNGIEIIKLSDSNFNLAVSFPLKEEHQKKKRKAPLVIVLACTSAVAFALFIAIYVLIHQSCKKQNRENLQVLSLNATRENYKNMQVKMTSGHQCSQFTLAEINIATDNFKEDQVIGEGGFGKVYKGIINDGVTPCAIKRCKKEPATFMESETEDLCWRGTRTTLFAYWHKAVNHSSRYQVSQHIAGSSLGA
ncbi:receptor-like protein kinase FERONIA [Arachis stenosperma]|uniref:receptor-like protein kinase FERONIA n=1 Tax=Arachis stenosperma TaxID=217475 RepID=UPI0025ACD980|nr:receptor-like protein kinase FERONIA [Arachis stenosperma]